MKIWIIWVKDTTVKEIVNVFSTKKLAEKYYKKHSFNLEKWRNFEIKSYDVITDTALI